MWKQTFRILNQTLTGDPSIQVKTVTANPLEEHFSKLPNKSRRLLNLVPGIAYASLHLRIHNADLHLNKTFCLHFLYLFTYLSVDFFSHQKSIKIMEDYFHKEPLTHLVNGLDWVMCLRNRVSLRLEILIWENLLVLSKFNHWWSVFIVFLSYSYLKAVHTLNTLNYCSTSNLVTSFHFLF